MEEMIRCLKKQWWILTIYLIGTSIIGMFIVSLVFEKMIELKTINEWISLILGFIATLVSIIGTILSFYNLEQANQSERRINNILSELRTEVIRTRDFQANNFRNNVRMQEVSVDSNIEVEEN